MATIKFYLNPRQRQDGSHALKLNIHMNHTTMRKDIGIEIPKKLWDSAKQQILGDYNGLSKLALNNALLKHMTKANEKLFELTQSQEIYGMTAKQFCQKLSNSSPIYTKVSFNQFFEEYIKRLEDTSKIGNAKAYKYALSSFKKFYGDELSFDEINYVLIKKYDESLIKRGLCKNGRGTQHRTIRALYNYAIKELDYVDRSSNPYLDFQIPKGITKPKNLELQDVQAIYNYDGQYQLARDLFMFSFFCIGIDVVDICHLTKDNIVKGRIVYTRRKVTKTEREVSIKITPEIQALIDKYSHGDYIFPFLTGCTSDEARYLKHTNARRLYNKKLKRIGEDLEFDLTLTSKVSRHSWATTAKKLGVSKDMISEMLGHKASGVDVTNAYLGDYDFEVKDDCNQKIIEKLIE